MWGTRFLSPTEQGPAIGNPFDWVAARQAYLDALTSTLSGDREAALARTFETLGHVMHLVQDLAVPAHVRNDFASHLEYCVPRLASFSRWCENRFERFVKLRPDLVDSATTLSVELAGQPVTRFWDLDRYTGFNPSSDTAQGLAEYTNANFFSLNTIFTESFDGADPYAFPYPRQSSTNLAELFSESFTVVRQVMAEDRQVDLGKYLRKTGDGETIERFLRVGYLARDLVNLSASSSTLRLTFQLDDNVHEDYATLLLPRAIGYSAALLDYFFRGKLDVDLVPADPNDPSIVRITGTNATKGDALADGELGLYADDQNGKRTPVAALDPTVISGVLPAGSITSARFQLAADAERFMVVYKGTLGNELKQVDQNNPGAVIGKALGGVRVEQIVNDGTLWKLRTPKGVFGLTTAAGPLTVAQYEVVKWGDTDSALVARTPLDVEQPAVVVFDVPRQPGSVELAMAASGTDVVVTQRKRVPFPSATLLTTVNFTQPWVYRQRLVRSEATATYRWVPNPPPNDNPDVNGQYVFSGWSFSPYTFDAVYEQTIPFAQSFPVRLDLPHNGRVGTVFDPYYWYLQDVGVDAGGRVLGLVIVYLDAPQLDPVQVPVFRLTQQGTTEQFTTRTIWPYFPGQIAPLLWALVDLERGTVVASTAGPVVTINFPVVSDDLDLGCCVGNRTFWLHYTLTYAGGRLDGTREESSESFSPTNGAGLTLASVTDVTLPLNGEQSLTVDGWLRRDLLEAMKARGRYTLPPVIASAEFLFAHDCDTAGVCSATRIHQQEGGFGYLYPGQFQEARRVRPVAGRERLVLLATSLVDDLRGTFGYLGDLVVWDPDLARVQFIGDTLPLGYHNLGSATGAAALVTFYLNNAAGDYGTLLYPLDPTQPAAVFPSTDLSGGYTLLEPSYLYSTADLKFHRPLASLDATALPATLAAGGGAGGDYHAIRLP